MEEKKKTLEVVNIIFVYINVLLFKVTFEPVTVSCCCNYVPSPVVSTLHFVINLHNFTGGYFYHFCVLDESTTVRSQRWNQSLTVTQEVREYP